LEKVHEVQRMLSSFIQTLSKNSSESEATVLKVKTKTASG